MKKTLSIFLAFVMLLSICACQQENSKGESSETMIVEENGVVTKTLSVDELDTHIAGNKVRNREVAQGTRMLVNEENPLFLFRTSLPIFLTTDTLISTYEVLPEDIREFSALLYGLNTSEALSPDEIIKKYDKVLDKTDKKSIPIFIVLEHWNSINTLEGFTHEQLCGLLERHSSLMGFVNVELSCNTFRQEHAERIKTAIRACKEYDALFIWQDMEYQWEGENNTFQRAFEDEELYNLMSEYSHNIIITDKHNGRGRHFSVQSSAMGAWLSGVCDNWGSNVEAWLWWEVGNNDYALNTVEHSGENYIYRYPPAVGGIDTIGDLVGGATVFSSEELYLNYTTITGVKLTETFWSVIYPMYQRILNGAVPDKEQVKEQIKVAYQFTSPNDIYRSGLESDLFIDTYGMTNRWYTLFNGTDSTKKWLPYTGRYYIIPSLPKYANASEVLPGVDILNTDNYKELFGSAQKKQEFLNSRYPETYTGNATLYSINNLTYIFNNNEFSSPEYLFNKNEIASNRQTADYFLKTSALNLSTSLDMHTYMILEDNADGLEIELVNLRLDTLDVCTGKENAFSFMGAYLKGKKMDNEADFRTTTITLTGFEKMPEIKVSGINNPTAQVEFDKNTTTATITIVSNGKVTIDVVK